MRGRSVAQRGQVTAMLVILATGLVAAFGLVYDGGEKHAAQDRADAFAEEAARAAARDVDLGAFHRSGTIVPDAGAAVSDAQAYLAKLGVPRLHGTVRLSGDTVVVNVSFRQPMEILGAGGLWSVTVTGEGRAHLLHGVQGAQP